ncbi:MAG: WG repeat-containing protein [Parafilimonas sp.]
MKIIALTFLLTFLKLSVFAQSSDTWTSFWNKDTTFIGYKDKNGVIKIEPKFQSGFTNANRFDNIIAVAEEVNQHWKLYYLTKSGRIVGRDSLHIFDNGSDCESEGYIRFRDTKTDKVGMFNRNGDIVIPAEYNDMSRVRNGLIVALKGATKKFWGGGEHYSWVGGKEILIDTANNILIDSFKYSGNPNFFSLLISTQPSTDTVRQNFKSINGKFYSFVDFDKEFNVWLKTSLLDDFTKERLMNAAFKEITYWKEPTGWTSETKNSFIDRNYELIRTKMIQLNSKDCDYTIFDHGLNPFIYTSDEYLNFFNNCSEPKDWIYPIKDIVISYKEDKGILQDHIEFLRTDNGYKLLSLTIRKGEIK